MGDVLHGPFSPEEVVPQFRSTKRTAPGADGIMYANCRWVDPRGLKLATIWVPSRWKLSTVTLIHKRGDTATIWPISLQPTIYKLYVCSSSIQVDCFWGHSIHQPSPQPNRASWHLRDVWSTTSSRRRKCKLVLTRLDLCLTS